MYFLNVTLEIVIYRHAEPLVSANEVISGRDFPLWVQRYNESEIRVNAIPRNEEEIVYTSNLTRSIETGRIIGRSIVEEPLLREAEIPMIRFPPIRLKAKYWLIMARFFWFSGLHTGCESFFDMKSRIKRIVDMFEARLQEKNRVVVVGHGLINRLIKEELTDRGWSLVHFKAGYDFLSKMIFRIGY